MSSSAATCSRASRTRSPTASSSTTTCDARPASFRERVEFRQNYGCSASITARGDAVEVRGNADRARGEEPMIELTVADGVAEVVLNAPDKLNALDPAGIVELSDAYGEAERMSQAGDVRALVLRGEGRAFCAGRDISGVDPRDDDVIGYLGGLVQPLLERMAAFPAPTFAVAHGACLGVGLGLLVASDIVYVADTAKIGSPFANLGATP